MNSFATRDDTLEALEEVPRAGEIDGLPLDFVPGRDRCPSCLPMGSSPSVGRPIPALEWAPPGHGDVFTSLATSGTLAMLLERGYEFLFLSNSDNLGAVLDPRILGWFASEGLPFVSEVVNRTEADRKGGHLARRHDGGGLVLRETAQVPEEDQDAFEDVGRHRFFNANNIWVNLRALERTLRGARRGPRAADDREPQDRGPPPTPDQPEVVQLETAMGAAIAVFDGAARGARAAAPLRARGRPAAICSWCARTRTSWRTTGRSSSRRSARAAPLVKLGSNEFKMLRDFDERFPRARRRCAPASSWRSRATCASGPGSWCAGACGWRARPTIPDGAVLEG